MCSAKIIPFPASVVATHGRSQQQPPFPCSALLFDLDGTLVHTGPDLAGAMNHVLQSRGLATLDPIEVQHLVGNGARSLLARGFWGRGAEAPEGDSDFEAAVQQFLAYYAHHIADHSHPYPGVMEGLQRLQEAGFFMAVVTNKPEFLAHKLLAELNMAHFFKVVVGGDTLPTRKPAPEMLYHATVHMASAINEAVMVGDSDNDILAAQRANIPVIAVNYGYNQHDALAALHPDVLVDCFGAIEGLVVREQA
ncbi:phosphoglycolate phosphatase [Magnetococcus marinus MC-1]|uniref:Phosphoglycolate phosphatase n=1 Tax=Magnetococcus marinus (strain ATCC BAA-1437 / JCM 17883 / MC-1) TaxID=156889 RepID=A0LCJ0_MAGMM|nr:phosphoglycolate phosphatase [Magnetococcus marinus]ABK45683.1 phosphoglycolate phosphatase [Magnetococcus marinus MC-1]